MLKLPREVTEDTKKTPLEEEVAKGRKGMRGMKKDHVHPKKTKWSSQLKEREYKILQVNWSPRERGSGSLSLMQYSLGRPRRKVESKKGAYRQVRGLNVRKGH